MPETKVASTVARANRAEETTKVAFSIIEEENRALAARTKKLREARLAREQAEAKSNA